MKHIESNPANVSIAVVYCFFGVLSFFVLKIAAKYFMKGQKSEKGKKSEVDERKISRKYLQGVNLTKVFAKTYFLKNTLVGSIVNSDKKYLLKQMFVLSCMAVSCFNINNYIMWPWAIGLASSLATIIVSQIVIPLISGPNKTIQAVDQSEFASNMNQRGSMGSIQIEINTRHEVLLSAQGSQTTSRKIQQRPNQSATEKSPNLQLFYIMLLAIVSEILICVCIIKLSLSVSNSGVLNLISFGIAIMIDQVGARISIGLTTYFLCLVIHKSKVTNLLENNIFYLCCSEAILKDLKRVHEEAEIEAKNNKVANEDDLSSKIKNDTGAKFNRQSEFSYQEKVEDDIIMPQRLNFKENAILEEQEEEQGPQIQPKVQAQIQPSGQNEQDQAQLQTEIVKDETNYFELYEHDVETFTEQMITTERSKGKVKKIKKGVVKPQEKPKSDMLLYFPYEQHKLSSHRNSVKHELKEFQNQMSLFEKEKISIADDFIKNIEVLQCMDDSLVTEEQVIGTILNEKNFNIKTLTINEKAQIPPTARPGHSATKRSVSKESIAVKKVKKVSPYLVDLQSQAIKPQKAPKSKKLMVSKVNKENANQTNNSFMPSETIEASRMTQKEFTVRNNWMTNENMTMGR